MSDINRFIERLDSRMKKGADEYQNKSFSKDISWLLVEVEEELLDICGWGYIAWLRLQKMQGALNYEKDDRCPHGNPHADCNPCDVAGDFAYDSWREG